MTEVPSIPIQRFIVYLTERVQAQDRGLLADLRRGFSPGTENRAWPHVASWCNLADDRQRVIWQTIGAAFATLEKTSQCGNLGVTLRTLALVGAPGKPEDALKSFDGRFRRLLSCNTAAEVCQRLIPIIRAAGRKSVPIDFEKLFQDLQAWDEPNSNVKIRWAATYWSADTNMPTEKKGAAEE